MKKTVFILLPLVLLVLEIAWVKTLGAACYLFQATILLFLLVAGLWCLLAAERKTDFLVRSFLLSLRGGAGSLLGVVMLIYLLLHVGWIGQSLWEYAHGGDTTVWSCGVQIGFLLLPFMALTLLTRNESKEVPRTERKILVTGLSLLDSSRKDLDGELAKLKDDHWSKWNPIRLVFLGYPNLQVLYLITSRETEAEQAKIASHETLNHLTFKSLFEKNFPGRELVSVVFEDVYRTDKLFDELAWKVMRPLQQRPFSDRELLFGITGSTAPVSAAMALHSVKSHRAMVYVTQGERPEVVEFHVPVFNLRELLDELIEKTA